MSELKVHRVDNVTTLTLDRPAKRNSLSADLVERLLEAVHEARCDDTAVLVLRGEGKCFSAGFDFTRYQTQSEGDLLLRFVRIETLLQQVEHAPFTTIALAQGNNFGAGVDLFAACTHRIATSDCSFTLPGLRFGLVLGTRRLARRTSTPWAHAVLEGSRTVAADEGRRGGLVTEVCPTTTWDSRITELAKSASNLTSPALRCLREALTHDTRDADLADLVRSAAEPGLFDRIRQFREG